ncbi:MULTISPECIES: glycosyl transferase [Sinorhizobium]|uniref:Glycosyl transferase n=1 Tax=Sinorhizobium americanum TaxID=194963 RepID=A0A2S3YHT8_9HYPH|nr:MULTISPECIES: glycosyl transferase [Sinorhizobium]ASY55500.1 Glycosyltransferase [Sinorhizobium sp. CCBAU 05631]PDT40711.1 glycosyl transferase [Sinorhizobium sp. FG01]PDT52196.1 glycosyl transferase [Sinorhizobium sp. NG07B]POH26309.1 glycosyl transferase [Sinorhizobium americanum]POH27928.1 glycosyl transferase [Sinorhizobium americanum]
MLTIIMETRDNEAELAQTLSVLVAGAVEGLVSDVIILDHGSRDGSVHVADAAGCRFCAEWDLADVVRSARGDWLMLLEPGARPIGRWVDELIEYLALNKDPARFSPSRMHRRPFFKRLSQRAAPLETGFLLRKQDAVAVARADMQLSDIANARAVRKLATEIVPAWVALGNRSLAAPI